jgi:transcriptional regulator GlxA family with amidase domain
MTSAQQINVYFVLLPGSLLLDWAGPAEALRIANQLMLRQGSEPRFVMHFVSPSTSVNSSVGVTLTGLTPLPAQLSKCSWVVLLGQVGQKIDVSSPDAQTSLQWLRSLHFQMGKLELITVCAGTLLAAHAGLLNGRHATTHHQHLEELKTIAPQCDVVSNRVFVVDGPVHSSAGVTTGIDLFLHRISETCGPVMAAQVAQSLVVALRRGPHDPELSPFLQYRNHLHPALHRIQDAIGQQPQQDWNVQSMADIAHTSPRHLARLFLEHLKIAPLQYLRRMRLSVAEAALQSGLNVTQAAETAGFSSDTQLRRAWHQFGMPGLPKNRAD